MFCLQFFSQGWLRLPLRFHPQKTVRPLKTAAARLEFLELPIMKEKGALETPLAATEIIFGLGKYHSRPVFGDPPKISHLRNV